MRKKTFIFSLNVLNLLCSAFLSAVGLLFDPGVRKCGCNCEEKWAPLNGFQAETGILRE